MKASKRLPESDDAVKEFSIRPLIDTPESSTALLVDAVILVVGKSAHCYQHLAIEVEQQTIRNLFFDMARIRTLLIGELEAQKVVTLKDQNKKSQRFDHAFHQTMIQSYDELQTAFLELDTKQFLNLVENREDRLLHFLKQVVRSIDDRSLASLISSKTASLQIMQDRFKTTLRMTFSC